MKPLKIIGKDVNNRKEPKGSSVFSLDECMDISIEFLFTKTDKIQVYSESGINIFIDKDEFISKISELLPPRNVNLIFNTFGELDEVNKEQASEFIIKNVLDAIDGKVKQENG
jgi:hypothetical protein